MVLTVVTATYNCITTGNKDRLLRCVKSVAKLKTEHEHLIYDGASTDGTVELLREIELKTAGLKVVSEPDTGIYNALNKGVLAARGEWFYVLGSDDVLIDPNALQTAIEEGEESCVDMIAAPVYVDDNKICSINEKGLFFAIPYPHQGFLIKTEVIRGLNGFNENFKIAADYDLVLRALETNHYVGHFKNAFAVYNTQGLSSDVELCRADQFSVLEHHLNMSRDELNTLAQIWILPFRLIVRYIVHPSHVLRKAAFYNLGRYILRNIGLIDDKGKLLRP